VKRFAKFIPLHKVEEQTDGTLLVWGRATAEEPDLEREVCDYDSTKPYYKALADRVFKATSKVEGMDTSLFPVREMHQLKAVGCGKSMEFLDDAKAIDVGVHVVEDAAIKKVKAGVLIGFSQGGDYVKTWPDPVHKGCTRYTAELGEISLVDSPCLPSALISSIMDKSFSLIAANGSTRLVKMQLDRPISRLDEDDVKRIAKALKAQLATGTPTPEQVRGQKIVDAVKAKGWSTQDAIARFEKACTFVQNPLAKGMWTVTEFASVLDTLSFIQECTAWEREAEGDASSQPADLAALLTSAIECFIAMVSEETTELAAQAAAIAGKAAKGAEAMKIKILTVDAAKALSSADLLKAFLDLQGEAEKMEKAAKGVQGHLANMTKAVNDHHSAVTKAAADHAADMHGCIAKCMKAAGADGAAGDTGGEDGKEAKDEEAKKAARALLEKSGFRVVEGGAPAGGSGEGDVVKRADVQALIDAELQKREAGRVRGVMIPRDDDATKAANQPRDTTDGGQLSDAL
jgi:hypothetical protein